MQIHCPSCAAVYNLPVILLTTARVMRCAVCAHDWQTTAVDPETAQAALRAEARPAAAVEPQPATAAAPLSEAAVRATPDASLSTAIDTETDDEPDTPSESPERLASRMSPSEGDQQYRPWSRLADRFHGAIPALLGWVCSFAILFISGRIAIQQRADLVAAWPPSKRLFLWLGLG